MPPGLGAVGGRQAALKQPQGQHGRTLKASERAIEPTADLQEKPMPNCLHDGRSIRAGCIAVLSRAEPGESCLQLLQVSSSVSSRQ